MKSSSRDHDHTASVALEKRDLSLTLEQRTLCQFLKKSYGFSYPFAAHIAKDVLAFLSSATLNTGDKSRDEH
jgi:hypothetical protein